MNNVTVATLYVDWLEKRQLFLEQRYAFLNDGQRPTAELLPGHRECSPEDFIAAWDVDPILLSRCQEVIAVLSTFLRASHTYLIARDHGLQAAMLYRLSNGAIDPREVVL